MYEFKVQACILKIISPSLLGSWEQTFYFIRHMQEFQSVFASSGINSPRLPNLDSNWLGERQGKDCTHALALCLLACMCSVAEPWQCKIKWNTSQSWALSLLGLWPAPKKRNCIIWWLLPSYTHDIHKKCQNSLVIALLLKPATSSNVTVS